MEILRAGLLVGAAMTMGLMAGVFGLYANTIMPGLRNADDRTFVAAFQSIDRAIMNPLFMATFVGALLSSGATVVLHLDDAERAVLPWSLAAFLLYLAVFIATIAVNVPLNDAIKSAGDPTASAIWHRSASASTRRSGRAGTSPAPSRRRQRSASSCGPWSSTDACEPSRPRGMARTLITRAARLLAETPQQPPH